MQEEVSMAVQQFHAFSAFFFLLGILLFAALATVGLTAGRDWQLLAAGAMIGLGILSGLCFLAASVVYHADQTHRGRHDSDRGEPKP
jgi:hypothetical protein